MPKDVIITQGFSKAYEQYSAEMSANVDNRPIIHSLSYSYPTDSSDIITRNPYQNTNNYDKDYRDTRYFSTSNNPMERIIMECIDIYENEPIVSNIIDLMSDFGSQGVRITCADKNQERFGQQWFKYIKGPERCERFLSMLFKQGTIIIKRTDGKVPLKTQKKWKSAVGKNGENAPKNEVIKIEETDTGRATIPLKWTYYGPCDVVMIGGELANFVGKPIFGLKINTQLRTEINQLAMLNMEQTKLEELKSLIPDYVLNAINTNAQFFPLDQSKVYAYYYKKDDNQLYGKPIIRPIIKDIRHLNKLRAADSAALDGVISSVRLWTVGSLEHGIVPNKGAIDKVRNMVANCVAGGAADLVYGPDLKFQESSTTSHQFLGSEKYQHCVNSINAGLGVPTSMTGNSKSNTTDFMGLRTLVERLEYGRTILVEFLSEQLSIVQKAMGFTKEFKIEFDEMVLSDEAAQKNLFIQLYDRGVISLETLRYNFNIDNSDVEDAKVAREERKRGKGIPHKASPYHNPEKEHDLMKLAVQKGGVTPKQVGLDLPEKQKGEKTFNESGETPSQRAKIAQKKVVGSPLTGRPVNSKDKVIRKKKRVLPKGASAKFQDLFKYAESAHQKVEEITNQAFITIANKKNVRSLSVEETETLEALKFRIFSNVQPYSEVNQQTIHNITSSSLQTDEEIEKAYIRLVNETKDKYGRELTISEQRSIACYAFASIYHEDE